MKKSWLGPHSILEKKREFLIPCVYHFYKDPPQIVRGHGMFLFDHTGKEYLDFYSGVSVLALGHCHPDVTGAITRQVEELQHTTTIYLTEPIVNLAERLAGVTPGRLKRSFFCASGSEANEGAALLAQLHTGRHEFISLQNSLHGRTKLGMSLTGLDFWRTDDSPVGGIALAPSPYCFRCPFDKQREKCGLECAKAVEQLIKTSTSGNVAAFFAEPIQGNGGIITPPENYFAEVKSILDKYSILLVADEVQTGFGHTGRMFAIEHWDVAPDIMTMGKALGGGTPVGAFITTDDIAVSYTRPGASTFGGNPVTANAGLAVLDVIERDGLVERAAVLGDHFFSRLNELKNKYPLIGDVRGKGLMLGAELVTTDKQPATEQADVILETLKDRGVFVGKTGAGRNVLTFQPPLIVQQDDVDEVCNLLDGVLQEIK